MKNKLKFLTIFTLLFVSVINAQVGIGTTTPAASSALDISSTTKGLLPPRMTAAQRDAITTPSQGLIIFCSDCASGEGELQIRLTSSWKNLHNGGNVNDPALIVGDSYEGGVVFYIFEPGDTGYVAGQNHGLVVAMSDVATSAQWGCNNTDLPNVSNVTSDPPIGLGAEIGDGFNNTTYILQDCPTAPAALAARSLGAQWFLPSTNELKKMYINRGILESVPGFTAFGNAYWSSTEYVYHIAWYQDFGANSQGILFKDYANVRVRAVRAF